MTDAAAWWVPGRIEVFGKHTDYAGGRALVCAVDRGVTVRASRAASGILLVSDAFGAPVSLDVGVEPTLPSGHWARYAQTVIDRLSANFGRLAPCRVEVASNLPAASGMSSSSALVCGLALALADLNGFSGSDAWHRHCPDRLSLAGYLATVENGRSWGDLAGTLGVGTRGGSEDHTAMLCGRTSRLIEASFDPPALLGFVEVPGALTFVVAVSGVLAEKTGAARDAYNAASSLAADALSLWNAASGRTDDSLAAAARSLVGEATGPLDPHHVALAPLRRAVAGTQAVQARLEHFLAESLRYVPAASAALAAGELQAFGELADASQRDAETLLGNQVPETVALARSARALGAHAASAFGAGFGGSVWALVNRADADPFATRWLADYRRAFPERTEATVLVTRPGAAARQLDAAASGVVSR